MVEGPIRPDVDRFNKYTHRARQVFTRAHKIAANSGSSNVTGTHFVLGIMQDRDCSGSRVISNLLRGNFEQFVRMVSEQRPQIVNLPQPITTDFIGLSEEAEEIMLLIEQENKALNHNYTGTEHQLLGILRYAEQQDVIPVFKQFGLTYAKAVEETKRILGPTKPHAYCIRANSFGKNV